MRMMRENTRDALNRLYGPLADLAREIKAELKEWGGGSPITSGFFNGHSHQDENGAYRADSYPIPVISVMGLCDIEIDFDGVTVTTKLTKERLLALDISSVCAYAYEIYGVEDYLADYGDQDTAAAMRGQITQSPEKEFFVTFSLPDGLAAGAVSALADTLKKQGFYY